MTGEEIVLGPLPEVVRLSALHDVDLLPPGSVEGA